MKPALVGARTGRPVVDHAVQEVGADEVRRALTDKAADNGGIADDREARDLAARRAAVSKLRGAIGFMPMIRAIVKKLFPRRRFEAERVQAERAAASDKAEKLAPGHAQRAEQTGMFTPGP